MIYNTNTGAFHGGILMNPIRSQDYQEAIVKYKQLSPLNQVVVSIFSTIGGALTLGFKFQNAFTWIVKQFPENAKSSAKQTSDKIADTETVSILKNSLSAKKKNQSFAFNKDVKERSINNEDSVGSLNIDENQALPSAIGKVNQEKGPLTSEEISYLSVYKLLFDNNLQAKEDRTNLNVYKRDAEEHVPLTRQNRMQFEKSPNLHSYQKNMIKAPISKEEIKAYLIPKGEKAFIIKSTDESDRFIIHILKKGDNELDIVSIPFKITEEGAFVDSENNIHADIYDFLKAAGTAHKHFADPLA